MIVLEHEPDAVVVGGGHNGLVCAIYLARAGLKVLVLEARGVVGGAAITRDVLTGYRVSPCAHVLTSFDPGIARSLKLKRHGLNFIDKRVPTIALDPNGRHIQLAYEKRPSLNSIIAWSPTDANAYWGFRKQLIICSRLLQRMLVAGDGVQLPRGLTLRERVEHYITLNRLNVQDVHQLQRWMVSSVGEVLDETFESDLLKGALGLEATLGQFAGPWDAGTLLTLALKVGMRNAGGRGAIAQPEGGMGAVSEALRKAAESAGVQIETEAPVAKILVEAGEARGVLLRDGMEIRAKRVISNADPLHTYLELVGPQHLDTGFVTSVRQIRTKGATAKLNLALDGLPLFKNLPGADQGSRMLISPDLDYVQDAFASAKYEGTPKSPTIELILPSYHDDTLAPSSHHVLSAVIQHVPYTLRGGWEAHRDTFVKRIIDLLAEYAPELPGHVIAGEFLTPQDIEREFGLAGGNWHHGEFAMDQMGMLRPIAGAGGYTAPVDGLYLCGAGTPTGGGVSGVAGFRAARRILSEGAAS